MPPFKDEHILIIAPGSQTTLAQLGLPESFTPAQRRFPSRVFLNADGKSFDPHKITIRRKQGLDNGRDVDMGGTSAVDGEVELVEDPDDDEGAIWPLKEGRIVNLEALFALLQYVHSELGPQLHTPVMLIAQPCWTAKDQENITTFIFERFKTPALCIMDSALATSYAFGIPNATVVDVGFEKVDVTAVTDFQITGRGTVPNSGGAAMTRNLRKLLEPKNFTQDMAEQLKLSHICEVLPPGTPLPGTDSTEEVISNPAAAASTGATSSGPDVRITEPPRVVEQDYVEEEEVNGDDKHVDDEGVLDVASILTSGKTQEFLAKKEREKAERAAVRKANKEAAAEAAVAAAKPVRLPNSKRPRAIFHYEEFVKDAPSAKRQKTPDADAEAVPVVEEVSRDGGAKAAEEPVSNGATAPVEDDAARKEQQRAARKEEKKKIRAEENPDRIRRDFEIGTERFLAADEGYLSAVADTVYRTVMSVDDVSKRQDAWDALVICGQGSRLRGFKDALVQTLINRYLVSPSSATMFMSELPSNLATPSGTGSMTPVGSFTPHQGPTASAVNPLLLVATTASNPALNLQLSGSHGHYPSNAIHSSHSQSPTSIKVASPPTYFPEWKSYEEAVFLGGQVAAKVIFVVDQGLSKGFLSRVEFNDEGPAAIHQIGLVY